MAIIFKVIFSGSLNKNANIENCADQLALELNKSNQYAMDLIKNNKETVLKTTENKKEAFSLQKKLNNIGLQCDTKHFASEKVEKQVFGEKNFQEDPIAVSKVSGPEWASSGLYFVKKAPIVWFGYFLIFAAIHFFAGLPEDGTFLHWFLKVIQAFVSSILIIGIVSGIGDQHKGNPLLIIHLLSGFQVGVKKYLFIVFFSLPLFIPQVGSVSTYISTLQVLFFLGSLFIIQLIVIDKMDCKKAFKLNLIALSKNYIALIGLILSFVIILVLLAFLLSFFTFPLPLFLQEMLIFFIISFFSAIYISSITSAYFEIFYTYKKLND